MISEFFHGFRRFFVPEPPPIEQPRIFRISLFETGESIYESEYGWTDLIKVILSPGVIFEMMYAGKPTLFVVKTVYVDLTNQKYDHPKDVVAIKVQKVS